MQQFLHGDFRKRDFYGVRKVIIRIMEL